MAAEVAPKLGRKDFVADDQNTGRDDLLFGHRAPGGRNRGA